MALKALAIIFISIGLIGLFVGLIRVRKLIAYTTVERPLWRVLSVFICLFILGYLIYTPYGIEFESTLMLLNISVVFCFGGLFVALVTTLSVRTIGALQNLEKLRMHNKELRFKAEHDDLTGLYKRNFFNQSVKYACEIAKHGEIVSSLFYIDLNKFKRINDTYGHQAGDLVLKKISELFIAYFRRDDIAARLGGDEFAILLINTRYSEAQRMSIKLIQKVLELQILVNDVIITPSISIGIAEISNKCFDPQMIMSQADQACYLQKKLNYAKDNIAARQS